MPINVTMPALSPTMEAGTLAKWLVKEGDTVEPGDVIAEIETDKATMEVEAVDEGRIGKILVEEGTQDVKVNEPIAILLEEDESDEDVKDFDPADAGDSEPERADEDKSKKDNSGVSAGSASPTAASALPGKTAPETPGSAASKSKSKSDNKSDGGRIFASPLARRLADQHDLDLSKIDGSGPRGRIIKADIDKAREQGVAASKQPSQKSSEGPSAQRAPQMTASDATKMFDSLGMEYDAIPNNNVKKVTARRLLESKQTVPHFYLTIECHIDELLKQRKEINDKADGEYKISVNDFIIKACANALKAYPAANVAWTDEATLQFKHSDISVAVATPNGLITPIIKKAETKGLVDISKEMKDLAGRARDGKLKPEEYQGGTFSVSNLGMFGIDEFSAIINPPQSCILAVGAGVQKPYVFDGEVKIGTFMKATLSTDHRTVDGAVGAEFLQILKKYIEQPISMLL